MSDRCAAWFDGDEPSDRTHTCVLAAGHTDLHECHCGEVWVAAEEVGSNGE